MKNSLKLLCLLEICCLFVVFPVLASSPNELEKLGLVQFQLENNFFGFEDLSSQKALDTAIRDNQYLPETILVSGIAEVRIPIVQEKYGLGLMLDFSAWAKVDDDFFKVYRELKKPVTGLGKYYQLDGEYELYTTYGVYQSYTLALGKAKLVISGKVFACPEYMFFQNQGQAFLKPSTNQPEIIVDANYQLQHNSTGSIGWGAGLGCELRLGAQDDYNFTLAVNNLPGLVYFSKVQTETGKTDTDYLFNPLNLSGMVTEEATWVSLPLQISGELNLPMMIGEIQLSGLLQGQVWKYSVGYLYPLYKDTTLSGAYDFMMENLKIGLTWRMYELAVIYGVKSQQFTGIGLDFKF